ncbi:MAG: acyl carrier protein [Proteobacteria bacterium]|nr:acyl carrier protein [Pseudomonadota bacterium]
MTLEDKVANIIADQLGMGTEEIQPEARFLEDLGADSLDLVELVMAMEDEFGISIPDDKIEEIKTVRDAVNYIRREPRGSN